VSLEVGACVVLSFSMTACQSESHDDSRVSTPERLTPAPMTPPALSVEGQNLVPVYSNWGDDGPRELGVTSVDQLPSIELPDDSFTLSVGDPQRPDQLVIVLHTTVVAGVPVTSEDVEHDCVTPTDDRCTLSLSAEGWTAVVTSDDDAPAISVHLGYFTPRSGEGNAPTSAALDFYEASWGFRRQETTAHEQTDRE